jgi:hypothetical protein
LAYPSRSERTPPVGYVAPVPLRFDADIWLHPGEAGWHFVTLPPEAADEIRARSGHGKPFGSVAVKATIGATTWRTSLFADRATSSYLLPVKEDVRRHERITAGERVTVELELRG